MLGKHCKTILNDNQEIYCNPSPYTLILPPEINIPPNPLDTWQIPEK